MGKSNDAGWSSPVAREAHNLEVVGSNPAPATWSSDKKSPTGAKSGDRGVFSFAGREIEPLIPRYSKGLRRSRAVSSLGGDVAHDSTYSHAWAFLDPLLPQTLDCLARPGLKEVVLALSGPTYPSWLRSGKVDAREHHKQTGKCRDRRRDAPWRLLAQFASRMEPSILRRRISRSVICDQAVCRSQMTSAAVDAEQKTLFDSTPNVGLR